jgi:acetyl esterase
MALRLPRLDGWRRHGGAKAIDWFFHGASRLGALHPQARPQAHDVEVVRNVAYGSSGLPAHRLDVWRPHSPRGPSPALLYIHGGGFRILSKDTHWVMALAFARRGYTVFSIDYRLAPQHPFPAALEDACAAWLWLLQHAGRYGAQLEGLTVAGESAGANLTLALALATCTRRSEPFAAAVFDAGVVPQLILPMCGILQVSDVGRFARRGKGSRLVHDRLEEVSQAYIGAIEAGAESLDLADPLRWLEREEPTARPLPPCFAGVGTADILLDDTRRLHAALTARGGLSEVRYYPRQVHAFHAFVFAEAARQAWRDQFDFAARVLGPALPPPR